VGISLVTSAELAKLLEAPNAGAVSVIDVRPRELYELGHVPGAISTQWEDWSAKPPSHVKDILREPGYWGSLDDPIEGRLGERLAAAGIRRDNHLIVYADGRASKGREGRVAWMLLFLGARNVSILNGGWSQWMADGNPHEVGVPQVTKGNFEIELVPERRIGTKEVLEFLDREDQVCLLDTRTTKEFQGRVYDYQPRMGHIPGSYLLPYNSIFQDDKQHFVTAETYRNLLPKSASKARIIAAYCEVGVRAATIAMLHEIYTGDILPVYDGSLMEWSLDNGLPVHQGDGKNR
jgi:Rhodanese-related sulfurtransferase